MIKIMLQISFFHEDLKLKFLFNQYPHPQSKWLSIKHQEQSFFNII